MKTAHLDKGRTEPSILIFVKLDTWNPANFAAPRRSDKGVSTPGYTPCILGILTALPFGV